MEWNPEQEYRPSVRVTILLFSRWILIISHPSMWYHLYLIATKIRGSNGGATVVSPLPAITEAGPRSTWLLLHSVLQVLYLVPCRCYVTLDCNKFRAYNNEEPFFCSRKEPRPSVIGTLVENGRFDAHFGISVSILSLSLWEKTISSLHFSKDIAT